MKFLLDHPEESLLAFVAIIYIIVGVGYFLKQKHGLGITYLCYAGANIGLIIVGLKS